MKKLRLIQNQAVELQKRETRVKGLPPLSPLPKEDCDLCGEPAGLNTPVSDPEDPNVEWVAWCGPCWRANLAVQAANRKLSRAEAESLIEPESRR